jgi:hypothetical protein
MWGIGDISNEFNNGVFFYGETGTIFTSDSKLTVFPAGRNAVKEEMPLPEPLMQENHVGGFLNAVRKKDRNLITCTPEDAFKSTATVQLAMISYYSDSVVKWDQAKGEIIDNPKAAAMMRREYRGKYVHP